jgi:outer membrane protein TolC
MKALVIVAAVLAAQGKVVTLSEALESTRHNNIAWQSLGENLRQAEEAKSIGIGLFLPKLFAEGKWVYMGERYLPDFSALEAQLATMGTFMGDLTAAIIEEHPAQITRFLPYLDSGAMNLSGFTDTIDSFVPKRNTLAATFSLVVPVFHADSIATARSTWDQYDAALLHIGYGREQLLYGVAKLYYGLVTLQSLVEVTDRAIDTAQEHLKSAKIRARLRTATDLEVKRAELEVLTAEAKRVALVTQLEKAKAKFRYLTGVEGDFTVIEPDGPGWDEKRATNDWQQHAREQRKDLAAARVEVLVAEHELGKELGKYAPAVDLIGAAMLDNNEAQRFDDDPFYWTVMAKVTLNIWDGGIRESQVAIARSKVTQARLHATDREREIDQAVATARKLLDEAIATHRAAEYQLQVAGAAQELAQAAEREGVSTYLEVIDANAMVEGAEANLVARRIEKATAVLELLALAGEPVPWSAEPVVDAE